MNREIKFKAKAVHNNEWVFGNYIHSKRFAGCGNEHRIHNQETGLESDVHPETVGQLTPFKDSEGSEIYENDIVQDLVMGNLMKVVFTDYGNYGLQFIGIKMKDYEYETIDPSYCETTLILAGSIHDNQKGGDNEA